MSHVKYERTCEICGEKFIRTKSDKFPVPRFCSNKCRFESQKKDRGLSDLQCSWCGKLFKRLVFPSTDRNLNFCSKKCGGKFIRAKEGCHEIETQRGRCELCGIKFDYQKKFSDPLRRFCSVQCSNVSKVKEGDSGWCSLKVRRSRLIETVGQTEADRRIEEIRSDRSRRTSGPNNPRFGSELSSETKEKISDTLKLAYASGDLVPPFAKAKNVVYKGVRLRSNLEFQTIKHLEETCGLSLGETLIYEDEDVYVKWTDLEGKSHTYIPDLHDVLNGIVYEVKPNWIIKRYDDQIRLKEISTVECLAKRGKRFLYINEYLKVIEPTHTSRTGIQDVCENPIETVGLGEELVQVVL
jgi:hypothetical protein